MPDSRDKKRWRLVAIGVVLAGEVVFVLAANLRPEEQYLPGWGSPEMKTRYGWPTTYRDYNVYRWGVTRDARFSFCSASIRRDL